jgi:hypothetical protein
MAAAAAARPAGEATGLAVERAGMHRINAQRGREVGMGELAVTDKMPGYQCSRGQQAWRQQQDAQGEGPREAAGIGLKG